MTLQKKRKELEDLTVALASQFALLKTNDISSAVKAVFVDDTVDEAVKQLKVRCESKIERVGRATVAQQFNSSNADLRVLPGFYETKGAEHRR